VGAAHAPRHVHGEDVQESFFFFFPSIDVSVVPMKAMHVWSGLQSPLLYTQVYHVYSTLV
jgi:hypothetical protein